LVNPAPEDIVTDELRRVTREGLTIVHSVVGRKSAGDAVPVVLLSPSRPVGRVTIVAHPQGKAALANGSGEPTALVRELLARGHDVVGFDPIFVAEALDSRNPVARRPDTDHFETYNPVLAGDQTQDLATVIAWARAQPHSRAVNLVASDLSGPQVLLARPVLQGLARTVVNLSGMPDPEGAGAFEPVLDLPGMFQFGGFKAAAALTAPAPLWIVATPAAFPVDWPKAAYTLSGAEPALRIEPGEPAPAQIADWINGGD
jgi:hypothetical protein